MEKNPFEIKFHNEFVSLIENLLKIFRKDRELTGEIKEYYKNYKKGDRFNYIHQTVETLETHISAVRQHDESIFVSTSDPLYLLPRLDFKLFWGNEYLEASHKILIWRYLTNLYVLGCHYIEKNDNYFQDMLKSLKVHQMLERQLEKEDKEDNEKNKQANQLTEDLQRLFKGLFSENSFVHEIFNLEEVQDVITGFKTNPLETIKRFMNHKGQGLGELVESVASKIKNKIVSGELDRFKIDQDIEKITRIVERLKRDLPKDPRFKKLFDMVKKNFNLDLSETFENPESAVKQFTEKFQETTGLNLEELQNETPEKLEEILRQSAEKAKAKVDDQEATTQQDDADQDIGLNDLVAAMNEIVESVSLTKETQDIADKFHNISATDP